MGALISISSSSKAPQQCAFLQVMQVYYINYNRCLPINCRLYEALSAAPSPFCA